MKTVATILTATLMATTAFAEGTPDYFDDYQHLNLTRDDKGVLVVEMHTDGGPIQYDARDHTDFVEAFYRIGRDVDNKIVILTGNTDYMAQIDFASIAEHTSTTPEARFEIMDEAMMVMDNLTNIRVPMIAAVEGKAHIHTEYALMADIVLAGESSTFFDFPHFPVGRVPGDGIFITWSHRAGYGRAESFLLGGEPITAQTAYDWGVVAEVVEDGTTVERAKEIAESLLERPEITRRNTRLHFIQPLKERLTQNLAFGLNLVIQGEK